MAQRRVRRSVPVAAALIVMGSAAATATGSGAAPAATPAGNVTVNAACYVNTAKAAAKVTVTGSGWDPGDTIALTDARGVVTATVTAASSGTFTSQVPAPVVPSHDLDVSDTIAAVDQGSQAIGTSGGPTAHSAPFLTTDYAARVSSPRPDELTFRLSGFTPNRPIYAHFLTAAGHWLGTVDLGRAAGPCGLRTVTHSAPAGHLLVQVDDAAHYSPRTTPQFRAVATVR